MPIPIQTVAVLDTSQDVIELLTIALEEEGIRVVADYLVAYRRGEKDLVDFFARHQPQAVIYDIAPPYEANWQFFSTVQQLSGLDRCAFVLTTTNKGKLEALVGPTASHELVGKPFDLGHIVDAVHQAFRCTAAPRERAARVEQDPLPPANVRGTPTHP